MIGRFLALLVAMAGCAGSLTRYDYAVEIAYSSALAADYTQTVEIVEDGNETNPVMGATGERVPPALYFPAVAAGHLAVVHALPAGWPRRVWQLVTLAMQLECVIHNRREGYGW